MMMAAKKMRCVLTIVLTLGLGVGCTSTDSISPALEPGVFSYNLDTLMAGVFNSMSPTMTLNEWFGTITPWPYDRWSLKYGTYFYRDRALQIPFNGSDTVDENTVVYCNHSFNGGGRQIGTITGKITLTNIPDPAAKVYIHDTSKGWWFTGKVDMSKAAGTSGTLDWSAPLYEEYATLNTNVEFALSVLPGGTRYTYEVPVPSFKTVNNANANLGKLGTVNIKGVTLSGTISVTYNGRPVPHVEIHATYPTTEVMNIVNLSSPEPGTSWFMILGTSVAPREIVFRVIGSTTEDWIAKDVLFDTTKALPPLYITNQDIGDIVLDLGNITRRR